ncbi:type II secretion system F family protein [Sinomonas sp. R1AF57]|uniref:type II secretion system F family protein n=1 Tax=Sinomonas sp. R1AF57 TaxID=2020377 RepID=UPI000B60BC24|nr:type II secretion system F family protein [Sinomonas sp. R1AF57]ASN52653.1 type II secretion system protein F [Sinomonas sp. R1AF57]
MVMAGAALVLVAGLVLAVLAARPGEASLPLSRRRPEAAKSSLLSRTATGATATLQGWFSRSGFRLVSPEKLELAGLRIGQAELAVMVGSAALAAVAVGAVVGSLPLGLLLAVIALAAPRLLVSQRIAKRRKAFGNQLDSLIDLLSGSLRAGHSILRAIDAAAAESPEPSGNEMRRVVRDASLGRDLLECLQETSERMANEDFVWVAQAIQINRQVGGNLAEVLDQVNETIRERAEIKGHVAALAAEGKFSAYILMALPVGIIAMLMVVNPAYMTPLFTTPLGWGMIAASAVLMTIGGLWLRKLISIRF